MKKIFALAGIAFATLVFDGHTHAAFAQTAALATNFLEQARASSDSLLGSLGSELAGKVQALESSAGTNSPVSTRLNGLLESLTGGADSNALASALQLTTAAKFTPEQLDLAKQVGNLTSAYVVQKNFSSLDGAQGDVATIVNSLRNGQVTAAVPALQNVAKNASLTDAQKQLITAVAGKYAPGLNKISGALNRFKKLPGF